MDWNAIGRVVVSVGILTIAWYVYAHQATANSEAISASLVLAVAGFWLHVLPSRTSNNP